MATETKVISTLSALSQSRYELMSCPHLYIEREVKGVREPENEYSKRGSQFHEGAADYVDHLVATRKSSDPEWFEAEVLRRSYYLPDALALLTFFSEHFSIDPEKVLGAEMYLAMDAGMNAVDPLEVDGPWEYEGTLDLVLLLSPTQAIIHDYKTFFRIEDPDTFQSEFYPLLLFKAVPTLQEIEFVLNFVRYNVPRSRKFTRADVPKLEKNARDARERQVLLHTMAEIQAPVGAEVNAMPGAHCAHCPKLRKGCPIAEINPFTNQTPEERVKFGIWLNEAKKENDRVLKALITASGPVQVRDANGNPYEAGFKLQEKGSYSIDALPIVNVNDPELAQKLTIGGLSQPLKTKKRAALRELVAPYRRTHQESRFGIKGIDDVEEGHGEG